jgi:hypothetical protein
VRHTVGQRSAEDWRIGWRRHVRPLTLVLVVVAVWLMLAAVTLWWARGDVSRGLQAVEDAQERDAPGDVARAIPVKPLRRAQRSFASSSRLLGSPVLLPVRLLPVAGRQLTSTRTLLTAASEVTAAGADAVAEARAALDEPHKTGPQRVALIQRLSGVAGRAEQRLARLELGSGRALIAPLASRRNELVTKLSKLRRGLRDGRVVADGLAEMLAGPRRYLVLAANNSEMRAGSGAFLSVGELTLNNGDLHLSEFQPAGDLLLPPHKGPAIEDADLAARWGWLAPNREWRALAATPRFPPNAALAARMWEALGNPLPDGVLALDPIALRGLLRATGPVLAEGRQVTSEEVLDLLLHDQYVGINTFDPKGQAGRREQLGVIAKGAVDALQQRDFDVSQLAPGLAEAARGRHLLAWSSRPQEQKAWEAAKVDGRLSGSSLALSVLNRGGNKLDRFLQLEATLRLIRTDQSVSATLTVLAQNTTPLGESLYIAGPYPGVAQAAGDYVGLMSLNIPSAASSPTVEGEGGLVASGPDGPSRVVAVTLALRRGEARTMTFRFDLPPETRSLRVEASARVPAVAWTAPSAKWLSGEARSLTW